MKRAIFVAVSVASLICLASFSPTPADAAGQPGLKGGAFLSIHEEGGIDGRNRTTTFFRSGRYEVDEFRAQQCEGDVTSDEQDDLERAADLLAPYAAVDTVFGKPPECCDFRVISVTTRLGTVTVNDATGIPAEVSEALYLINSVDTGCFSTF